MSRLHMFEKSAPYYDKIYGSLDYEAGARTLRSLIDARLPGARTLLDVACGTGRYLAHLGTRFEAEGLDILPQLLDLARKRCPDARFHHGDMIDFDLGREFDVVTCLFCSIGYAVTLDNAERSIARMAAHVRPGGLLIVEPWITPEQCWTNKVTTEVVNEPELRIVRMHTHEVEGRTSVYDIHCLIGAPQGVEHFVEREVLGLFTHEEYEAAFRKAGLDVTHYDQALFPGHKYGLFIASRPG
ncbi:MAG TPA: methyltransferase domain-containing protein [Rhodocyclaceae bacterium]|nr:methyltransferase domain-containing protein [Rhodocyclaceae bacterium]HRQ47620.1 methyltransferase domain-containing protein [Rhodocyclaceae bacterium]